MTFHALCVVLYLIYFEITSLFLSSWFYPGNLFPFVKKIEKVRLRNIKVCNRYIAEFNK